MANHMQPSSAETKVKHLIDVEACWALAPRDPLLSITHAGQLLSEFDWHGQQAWLIRSKRQREIASGALVQLASVVLSFTSVEDGEALQNAVRSERDAFHDDLSSEGHLDNWESTTEELNALAATQATSLPLLLIEARKDFLSWEICYLR